MSANDPEQTLGKPNCRDAIRAIQENLKPLKGASSSESGSESVQTTSPEAASGVNHQLAFRVPLLR
jgi:hypothetical protein